MRQRVLFALTLALFAALALHAQGTRQTTPPPAAGRGRAAASPSDADRAVALLKAVQAGLAEPKSDERDARVERLVGQLDKLPDAAAFDQKFSAHQRMGIYYRSDDADEGIVRHATWIIEAATRCTPEQHTKYTSAIVSAYLNLAQAWADRGLTDLAIGLLRRAPTDLPDIPSVARSVRPDLERLALVGTAAAPITAPRWLNAPAGTTIDLKGHVTLLEFSAHWCVPCKKSYPAVNRLREQFGGQGFRVVLATELYGFFEKETELAPATEFERDRGYFAANHLDVPIAVNDDSTNNDDPNKLHYKVGGIPQIQLIDKHGVIRLIMVGYDDHNEAALGKMIEGLLNEK